jgi:hypothetical protein
MIGLSPVGKTDTGRLDHDLFGKPVPTLPDHALKGVCFRFLREEQPWKCPLRRFVAAQTGLDCRDACDIVP